MFVSRSPVSGGDRGAGPRDRTRGGAPGAGPRGGGPGPPRRRLEAAGQRERTSSPCIRRRDVGRAAAWPGPVAVRRTAGRPRCAGRWADRRRRLGPQPDPGDVLDDHRTGVGAARPGRADRRRGRSRRRSSPVRLRGGDQRPRWTSPASSAVLPPPGSSTTSWPDAVDARGDARPAVPRDRRGRAARRARARPRASPRRARRAGAPARRAAAPSVGSTSDGLAAEAGRAVAQLLREVLGADGDVEADAEDRPALERAPLDEDPGGLAPVEQHVVGPLDPRRRRRTRRRPRPRRRAAAASAGRAGRAT